jgi:hypothetical protein
MSIRHSLCFSLLLFLAATVAAQSHDPLAAFLEGNRQTFSTMDHPKSKGVYFTISIPEGWTAEEGERPNIVQKFTGPRELIPGRGPITPTIMIITKELPLPPGTVVTPADLRDLYSPSGLEEMVRAGAVYINAQSTTIEATPAGILEYTVDQSRAGIGVHLQAWTLIFMQQSTMVQVQFAVGGTSGSDQLVSRKMGDLKPLFIAIANSIVFPEKWTTAGSPPAPGQADHLPNGGTPANDTLGLVVAVVVSFLITWSVGLLPPLLIRYAILRRPMTRKVATAIAAGLCACFWLGFRIMIASMGDRRSGPGT